MGIEAKNRPEFSLERENGIKTFIRTTSTETERLTEGTWAAISIISQKGDEILNKKFTEEVQFFEFIKKYVVSFPGSSPARSLIIPSRAESWSVFAKDLFFPTLANQTTCRGQWAVANVSRAVAGLFIDLITLAPRIAAAPFKLYGDSNETNHPLTELLKDNPDARALLKKEYLIAKMNIHKVDIKEISPIINSTLI